MVRGVIVDPLEKMLKMSLEKCAFDWIYEVDVFLSSDKKVLDDNFRRNIVFHFFDIFAFVKCLRQYQKSEILFFG